MRTRKRPKQQKSKQQPSAERRVRLDSEALDAMREQQLARHARLMLESGCTERGVQMYLACQRFAHAHPFSGDRHGMAAAASF